MREAPWMLVTHHQGDAAKSEVGIRAGGVIRRAPDELAGRTMLEVLGEWDTLAPVLRGLDPERLAPVEGAVLLAPLLYPPKVLCAGANYYAHLAEMGVDRPRARSSRTSSSSRRRRRWSGRARRSCCPRAPAGRSTGRSSSPP